VKLPRDLSGHDLAHRLRPYGYEVTRQVGSHMRLTTQEQGKHHITIPAHDHLRVGTLEFILASVAHHLGLKESEFALRLFGMS
jgi:predicted RNA binding protein YcfA (HicA-like mRNA interferase family)